MIFIDSSIIIAYKNADDINHDKSVDIINRLVAGKYRKGIISEFVFAEVTTVIALRLNRDAAIETGDILLKAKQIEIIKASDVFGNAWTIFRNQTNTKLSFVDASNLACMELTSIDKIATFDKDFLKIKTVTVVNS